MTYLTVIVFGVFDLLHDGHKEFLRQAKRYGNLIVVVARDAAVQQLKNKMPHHSERKRMEMVKQFLPEAVVVLGDEEQGSYKVVKTYQPAMICLGYDQQALGKDLLAKMDAGVIPTIPLRTLNHARKRPVPKLPAALPH